MSLHIGRLDRRRSIVWRPAGQRDSNEYGQR